jgi:hypothetical protein
VADRLVEVHRAHIDISRNLDGEPVVLACFDLREDEVAAAAHAVAAIAAERYRTPRISADDVLELRELTALADELEHGIPPAGPGDQGFAGPGDQGFAGPADQRSTGAADQASATEPSDPVPATEPSKAMRTLVLRPARLSVLRDAVARFVESRDEAEWLSQEDRERLALLRAMLLPLEQLCAEAMRAALSPESQAC